MKRIAILFAFLLLLTIFPALQAQSDGRTGSFAFTLNGYMVQGQLVNAIIHPDNSVTLDMAVDDTMRTSAGNVPISGRGEWYGAVNGSLLSGTVQNVHGTARICILFFFFCSDANYIGQGTWEGTLSDAQGTGTFQGSITFTSSPVPQIPVNRPIPVSGTWSSNFQLSS